MTPTERAFVLALELSGTPGGLTTAQIAARYQVTHSGAYRLMCRVSRLAPVVQTDDGAWVLLESGERLAY